MKFINGYNFQSKCQLSISKKEHRSFENENINNWIDADSDLLYNYNNPELVYINSSLLSEKEKLVKSDIRGKLKTFKNPFYLILHNSDGNFEEYQSDIVEYDNIIHIYSQNLNYKHDKVTPIPIGIANPMWEWGDQSILMDVINMDIDKTNDIYYNFKENGGLRHIDRIPCKQAMDELGYVMSENVSFKEYLINLKSSFFTVAPQGNGYDTHRMWEALYLKTIPIVKRTVMTEYFEKYFPIIILDDWKELSNLNFSKLYFDVFYDEYYELLNFENYFNKLNICAKD